VYELRGTIGHGGPGSEGPANHAFFSWLTDPEKNGGGALVDFGCYGAAWSLWYLGPPETVYARAYHLQPARFPKVEDRALIELGYKQGDTTIDASWDLPRAFQDLEVIGRKGTLTMTHEEVTLRQGNRKPAEKPAEPLPPNRAAPLATMVNAVRTHTEPGGITGLDLNVEVMRIIEAAKKSVETGQAVPY
jgi:predicted dehydrogenase